MRSWTWAMNLNLGNRDEKGETNLKNVKRVNLTEVCDWLWGVQEDGMTPGFLAWVTK